MANKKEKYRFDTELLISTIEQKPCIWDTSSEDYKNHDIKNKAWQEVAEILIQNFVNLDETKQQEAIKVIQQRWKSARDAYRRDRSKLSTSKSGQAAKTYKKYIYFENLKFLNKTLDLNKTDTNFDVEESQDVIDMSETEDPINQAVYEEERVNTIPKKRKQKNQNIDEKLMEFLNNSKKSEDNGNRAFLESLLPTLDSFDEAKSLQFRAEVLRIMMQIKNIPTIAKIHSATDNSNIRNCMDRQSVSYQYVNLGNSSGVIPNNSTLVNYPQSSNTSSASGYSDHSRPQSSVSYVPSPLSSNEYEHSSHLRLQHRFPIENEPDQPTLMQLTGVHFDSNA